LANPIIQVRGLRKVYRVGHEQVVALSQIDFDVPAGQVCCIVGTSGSGKSTLLNQLAGLEKPTKGQVIIGGHNISVFSENRLALFRQKNIGFIFQSYNLMPSMTALENVSLPLIFRGISKQKRERAAKRILAEVGLGGRMRHTPAQMSGGQQQRVGIARAFVARPKIIFADEPTGNLDSKTTVEVMRMMIRLCHESNQTLIIVTHDPNLARYADRIITILDGSIVSDMPNQSIAYDESEPETKAEEAEGAQTAGDESPHDADDIDDTDNTGDAEQPQRGAADTVTDGKAGEKAMETPGSTEAPNPAEMEKEGKSE
jgi:putative ABC transport system ATP-binding protein